MRIKLKNKFILSFPLPRVHLGIPTGNSDSGFLVFGEGKELKICFSLASCWDRRNDQVLEKPCPYDELIRLFDPCSVDPINDKLRQSANEFRQWTDNFWWPSSRIAGGRVVLHLREEIFSLTLDYNSGMISASARSGTIQLLASLHQNALIIRDPNHLILRRFFHPASEYLQSIYVKAGISPAELFHDGCFQPLPSDPGTLAWFSGDQLNLALREDTSLPETPLLSFESVLRENRKFWRNYWKTVPELELPDDLLSRFFRLALYKFALATLPGGVPSGLQGPWLEDYQRAPWSADYHFNVNVQQIYTLAPQIGKSSHMKPLFDMLESPDFQSNMKQNAKALFGIDNGLLLTHAVTDRGRQCGGISAGAVLDFVCGAWTALLYWMYYCYTEDTVFLRTRALPFMRGVMNVLKAGLREKNGKLELPLAISAEYGCTFAIQVKGKWCNQNTGRNPSNPLSCCHFLANALMAAEEILGETPDPFLREIKEKLPHFSTVNSRVALWEGQDLDVCHRHHSHLSMIYPFDITGELNEEERNAVDNAVEHWIWRGAGQWSEWSYPWAALLQARWGMKEAPSILMDVWKRLFLNESLASVYLPRFRGISSHRTQEMRKPGENHEIMQLDGTMAGATALLEMVVQEKNNLIVLFPAIPETWKNLDFKRIHLSGGIKISGCLRNGIHGCATFESRKARTIFWRPAGVPEAARLELMAGIPRTIEFQMAKLI